MKYYKAFLSLLLFIVILFFFYYIHITFFKVNVILYSTIFDGFLATGFSAAIIFILNYFYIFNRFEKTQMVIIWLLIGYIFAISIPTIIDRSLSFYILEKIQQRGGGIQLARFEEVFTKEYVKEHRLVDVRLTEQQESGTIIIQDGCVKLTERGHQLAAFSRYFRQNLLPKQRLLMGQYSDDLTDPFRYSESERGYECQ
jgi:hypothetical protein